MCRTCKLVRGGKAVGVDPTVITAAEARRLDEKIKKAGGKGLVAIAENLVDEVWGKDRPARVNNPVFVLDEEKFAGKPYIQKLAELRVELEKKKTLGIIVGMLDEVAWFFNLRGSDIAYSPVFYAYAIITHENATIFIDDSRVPDEVKAHLKDHVKIKPYNAIFDELSVLKTQLEATAKDRDVEAASKYFISTQSSWALSESLGGKKNLEEARSPIEDAKAIKNATELEGLRKCHIRDGAAISEFLAWLEDQLINKKAKLNEYEAALELEKFRR
jgi:Xaa-Pro aminopeptidase